MIKVKYTDYKGKMCEVDLATYNECFGVFEETHLLIVSYITFEAIYKISLYLENHKLKKALQNYFPELLL